MFWRKCCALMGDLPPSNITSHGMPSALCSLTVCHGKWPCLVGNSSWDELCSMAMLNHRRKSKLTLFDFESSIGFCGSEHVAPLTNAMEIPYEDHETTATKTCRCEFVQKQGTKTLRWLKNSCLKFTWQFRWISHGWTLTNPWWFRMV